MLIYHLGVEQQACWWLYFRDVVSVQQARCWLQFRNVVSLYHHHHDKLKGREMASEAIMAMLLASADLFMQNVLTFLCVHKLKAVNI
jgi:hypothetical protein